MAANRVRESSPSLPVLVITSTTGDSGGMYQTIGMVRYSGCSGSAILVLGDQLVDGAVLGGLNPVVRHPLGLRGRDDGRVERVEEHRALGLEQLVVVLDARRLEHLVGVVEHEAEVAQPADAGLRADRRLALLDPRVAERALLRLAGLVVEVDLLVRAGRHAHAASRGSRPGRRARCRPRTACTSRRTGRPRRRRVQAVLADARQVEHEGLLELHLHLLAHRGEDGVVAGRLR